MNIEDILGIRLLRTRGDDPPSLIYPGEVLQSAPHTRR